MHLEPVWETDEDEILIGLISSVIKDADDNFYLLDSQLSEVQVVSSDGEYLRTISGEGEGPGEIRRASELVLMPDGTIGIVQRWPGSIVKLDSDGTPAGTMIPGDPTDGGRESLREARSKNGLLVLGGSHNRRGDGKRIRNYYISKFNPDGTEQLTYLKRENIFDFSAKTFNETDDDFAAPGRWDISDNGNVYIAPESDKYHIDVYNSDGDIEFSFNKDFNIRYRSKAELQKLNDDNEARFSHRRWYKPQIFSETDKAIKLLRVHHDGTIWILDSYGAKNQPDGVISSWDVFSADGNYLRRVEVVVPGRNNDRLFFVDSDHVVIVHGFGNAEAALQGYETDDDASPVKVVCYRIVK
ncbi:6-bladed beta-propeller [bacterium]|nr:6-bladed beta-propeller [bacterium]